MTGPAPAATPGGRPRPRVIALGGAARSAPSHTLAALEAAVTQGADGLAVAAHLSADRQLMVAASGRLDRLAGAEGPLGQKSLRELKRLDAGGWFGRAFRGQRLQALGEVLERFRGRVEVVILLAGGADFQPEVEERLLDLLWLRGVASEVTVGSADHHALRRFRALDPDLRLLALLGARPLSPAALVGSGRPPFGAVGLPAVLLAPGDVGAWQAAGLECLAWDADEPAQAGTLAAWGVSALVTTRPGEIRAALADTPGGRR
jgi:glycerophosphoryl diester phosphodiesterase